MIGFAICGSFCTHAKALAAMKALADRGEDVLPILSFAAAETDTRFGRAEELLQKIKAITPRDPILTIAGAEPLGPKIPLEALIIAPCTGNTLAKLAHGITDTPVTMAVKAHRRATRPLLIALASNDAMAANLSNLAIMLEKEAVFFVPMHQDDPINKPHSLVADLSLVGECLDGLRQGRQRRPLFLS